MTDMIAEGINALKTRHATIDAAVNDRPVASTALKRKPVPAAVRPAAPAASTLGRRMSTLETAGIDRMPGNVLVMNPPKGPLTKEVQHGVMEKLGGLKRK